MKIGIIGLGDIAQKAYLPVITQKTGIELVFCTRQPETVKKLSQQYRISEYCTQYQDLLKHNVDAVMIHAATAAHHEIAQFFLSHHIPTFVDKPLADSAAQCEELYDIAEKHQQPLYVALTVVIFLCTTNICLRYKVASNRIYESCVGKNIDTIYRVN